MNESRCSPSDRPTYTPSQLHRYFAHISFPHDATAALPPPTLAVLRKLMTYHLARVPFENLAIHYSPEHTVCLDLEVLYAKVVERGRGGYCMEMNGFFSVILQSLGYDVWTTGARVAVDGVFAGWNHMVSIVTVDGQQQYSVDVGFGGNGPVQPLPLVPDVETPGAGPQEYRLMRAVPDFVTNRMLPPLWVMQHRNAPGAPWQTGYAFSAELEFFRDDYEVMSFATSREPDSLFRRLVCCVTTVVERDMTTGEPKAMVGGF